jgi:hypothetical protein
MDVLVLIDKLDDLVHNAKAVPLTDQVRIDREEIYEILDQMRATIPEEIKQARWIVKERQEMLAEAKRECDRLLVRDAGHHGLLRALVEALAPAPDGPEELIEVDLERREDRVGPVLHLEPRLARLPTRLLDDLLRLPLGELDDLGLRGLAHGLLARLAEDPVALALRLGQHFLPFLDDPARLLDLLRDGRAHLIEDVVNLLAVDAHLVCERHGLGVVHEVVEFVDQNEDVHMAPVYS